MSYRAHSSRAARVARRVFGEDAEPVTTVYIKEDHRAEQQAEMDAMRELVNADEPDDAEDLDDDEREVLGGLDPHGMDGTLPGDPRHLARIVKRGGSVWRH